ncbi:ABC transporter substrate-binding protein [Vibrio cholerae]|nr:ABC transporter substrate-binding protein [Vibrio cholerae]EGQ9899143.1 ABC transporter substrate-binding protein [Vibrio cholerae]EGR0074872.1 ABC transporter substrate-binding protein [Vibrio cholerae]EGR0566799.1 ABC transporter substrate-binding protein [Vibrio cholerae]
MNAQKLGICPMQRWIFALILPSLLLTLGVLPIQIQAAERELVILTTFSREPLLPLVEEFSRRYQGVEVQIIHRRAQSSVQLLNKSYIQNIDLVLSSSPYLMHHLAQSGKLVTLPEPMQTPEWLKPYALPITDQVATIGYSGAGLVWNQDYLKTHQLPEPKQFSDLAKPIYFGHVTMSTPARSGTTQMMVESILAKYGWQKGWEILLRVGANLATASARSFGVSDYIANGQFGVGPTIDSYALILGRKLDYVQFVYDESFTLMPTYVAQVRQNHNDQYAKAFIELLMSSAVQTNMEGNDFAKHSVQDKSLFNEHFTRLPMGSIIRREECINALFDLAITKQLPQLKDTLLAVLEAKVQFARRPSVLAKIGQIEHTVFTMPISEQEVDALAMQITPNSELSEEELAESAMLLAEKGHEWQTRLEKQLEQANQQLKMLLAEEAQ